MTDVPNTDASDDALSDFPHASDPARRSRRVYSPHEPDRECHLAASE
ncbi:MAG: hypothetical protein ACF8SC_06375 [Phycisphaerales bacterium JB037]